MCRSAVISLPRCIPSSHHRDDGPRSLELLESLGALETWKGNTSRSCVYLNAALTRYEEEANAKGVASVLVKHTAASYRAAMFGSALTTATTALDTYVRLGDARGANDASYWLASCLAELNRESEALPIFRKALEWYQKQEDDIGAVHCLVAIGEVQRRQLQRHEALAAVNKAVEIATKSGDRLGAAKALRVAGDTHLSLKDMTKAAVTISELCLLARKLGWDEGVSAGLGNMASLKVHQGGYHEAQVLYQESILVARRSGRRRELAKSLWLLGKCLETQSRLTEAAPLLCEAWELFQEMGAQNSPRKRIGEMKKNSRVYNAIKMALLLI
ncbi:hypothetical protein FRB90_005632 [Tulasnella sp. 427]|nr:hypothetical protein FRB90_005632 [Tulasnella sp. 427]